jgi:hypothetical protein
MFPPAECRFPNGLGLCTPHLLVFFIAHGVPSAPDVQSGSGDHNDPCQIRVAVAYSLKCSMHENTESAMNIKNANNVFRKHVYSKLDFRVYTCPSCYEQWMFNTLINKFQFWICFNLILYDRSIHKEIRGTIINVENALTSWMNTKTTAWSSG